jgi:hypothetical protein
MKLTRRQLVVTAAASVAAMKALGQPAVAPDPVKTAHDNLQRNADTLAKLDIPMSTEPAFQFKA